jgi:hypothetical protein
LVEVKEGEEMVVEVVKGMEEEAVAGMGMEVVEGLVKVEVEVARQGVAS